MISIQNMLALLALMMLAGCCRFNPLAAESSLEQDCVPVGRTFYRYAIPMEDDPTWVSPEKKVIDQATEEIFWIKAALGITCDYIQLSGCVWLDAPPAKALEFRARLERGIREPGPLKTAFEHRRIELFDESEIRELIAAGCDKSRRSEILQRIVRKRHPPEPEN